MRLVLVRHGSTATSEARRFAGWADEPLSALGREQARGLGERLAGETWAGVWSSDLRRTIETARLAGFEPVPDARLRELDFGEIEGRGWDELDDATHRALRSFEGFRAPGGESGEELRARVLDFLRGLSGDPHLLFTHGGVIRLLLRMSGGGDGVGPAGVVDLDLEPPP